MRRSPTQALVALLLLTACKIERTPQQFFDQREPIAVERQAAAEEVQARILAFGQALSRGSRAEAVAALSPTHEVFVIAPATGGAIGSADQLLATLDRLADSPTLLSIGNVQVEVAPRANVAWFRATAEIADPGQAGIPLRVTGVYVLIEGRWQLAQAHLSAPMTAPAREESPEGDGAPAEAG